MLLTGIKRIPQVIAEEMKWRFRTRSRISKFEEWIRKGDNPAALHNLNAKTVKDQLRQGRNVLSLKREFEKRVNQLYNVDNDFRDQIRRTEEQGQFGTIQIIDDERAISDLKFIPSLHMDDMLEKSYGYNINLGRETNNIAVKGAPVFQINYTEGDLLLERCIVRDLILEGRKPGTVTLIDCWIGKLFLQGTKLPSLNIQRGNIQSIELSDSTSLDPSDVELQGVRLETDKKRSGLFDNIQNYQKFRSYLEEHDNPLAANEIRKFELRAQRSADRGVTWLFSYVYDIGAAYGASASRPFLWALGVYVLTGVYIAVFDGGALPFPRNSPTYEGWRAIFVDQDFGQVWRSFWLPFQATFNPVGLFSYRQFVVPSTGLGQVILTVTGLLNLGLILMGILAIRKRFKLHE